MTFDFKALYKSNEALSSKTMNIKNDQRIQDKKYTRQY